MFEASLPTESIESHTDVETLMLEKNCYFVHMVQVADLLDVSENNKALDTRKLTPEERFDLLYTKQPTLSASTLRPHTEDGTFFGGFGVLISKGTLLSAHAVDAGTVAVSAERREGPPIRNSAKEVSEAIDRSHEPQGGRSYNEVVIKDPHILGAFMKLGAFTERTRYETKTEDLGTGGAGAVEYGVIDLSNSPDVNYDRPLRVLSALKEMGRVFVMDEDNMLHVVEEVSVEERCVRFMKMPTPPDKISYYFGSEGKDTSRKDSV